MYGLIQLDISFDDAGSVETLVSLAGYPLRGNHQCVRFQ